VEFIERSSIGIKDARTIYYALSNMNAQLWNNFDMTRDFKIIYERRTDGKWGGWYSYGTVIFSTTIDGQLPIQNAYHEIGGHVIDFLQTNGRMGTQLKEEAIYDENGDFVTGVNEKGVYERTAGLGYIHECKQTDTYCTYEQHPPGWAEGNTGYEDVADMAVNYFSGTIDLAKPAGRAINEYIGSWYRSLYFFSEADERLRRKVE
jgi:hypothetical protein